MFALYASARDLCEVIGIAITLELCRSLGGIRVTADKDAVRTAIGSAAQEQLITHHGKERFEPPRCLVTLRALEINEILKRLADGDHVRDIARAIRCTEQRVCLVQQRAKQPPPSESQADLFAAVEGNTSGSPKFGQRTQDHLLTEVTSVRQPCWLIAWMRAHEETQVHLVREAMIECYGLAPPSIQKQ